MVPEIRRDKSVFINKPYFLKFIHNRVEMGSATLTRTADSCRQAGPGYPYLWPQLHSQFVRT